MSHQQHPYLLERLKMLNINLEIPEDFYTSKGSRRHMRKIERIPCVLREDQDQNKHDYDPRVVSFGPYHHGKPYLYLREHFKHQSLEIFISGSGKDKSFFYDKILEDIDEIRGCYIGVSKEEYDDEALAEMMLLDGCFLINHIEVLSDTKKLLEVLYVIGMVGLALTNRDVYLLENQIPFRVINLLITLRYGRRIGEELMDNFVRFSAFPGCLTNCQAVKVGDEPPLHLLDAVRRTLVPETWSAPIKPQGYSSSLYQFLGIWGKGKAKGNQMPKGTDYATLVYTCRAVTDLKAKGIHFRPSPTVCLKDVKFRSYSVFFGELSLPVRYISKTSKAIFSNLVAYEISPNNVTDYAVSSYINLMKSLIHSADDVKELREQKILICDNSSDEEIVQLFKGMCTYGMENAGIFYEVKQKLEEHYNSRAKTWMAELMHNYFESPWTAIALFAAIFLLCLTFLQTLYTIHPIR